MSCGFTEDLTAYLDRELSPLKLAQVEHHLPGCPTCTQTVQQLSHALRELKSLPVHTPSAQLRREVLTRIAQKQGLQERLSWLLRPSVLVPALSASAAIAVALAAVQSRSPDADPPMLVADATELELAQNLEVVEDLDVLGLDTPEDLEIVEQLEELEGQP